MSFGGQLPMSLDRPAASLRPPLPHPANRRDKRGLRGGLLGKAAQGGLVEQPRRLEPQGLRRALLPRGRAEPADRMERPVLLPTASSWLSAPIGSRTSPLEALAPFTSCPKEARLLRPSSGSPANPRVSRGLPVSNERPRYPGSWGKMRVRFAGIPGPILLT